MKHYFSLFLISTVSFSFLAGAALQHGDGWVGLGFLAAGFICSLLVAAASRCDEVPAKEPLLDLSPATAEELSKAGY